MTHVTRAATTRTAVAIFALWGASWGLSYLDLGGWSLAVALVIAAMKAALVVVVFMEIVSEGTSVHATLVTGVAMILLLIFFMVADVRTRDVPLLPPDAHAAASR